MLSQSHDLNREFDKLTKIKSSYFLGFFLIDFFYFIFNIEFIEN
jgi:hypothetical protein